MPSSLPLAPSGSFSAALLGIKKELAMCHLSLNLRGIWGSAILYGSVGGGVIF